MKEWYRLYVESVGGGTFCEGPRPYACEHDAIDDAYHMATEDYESFEGLHGIPDIADIMSDKEGYNLDEDATEDQCWEVYYEQRENWMNYWVKKAEGPDDIDENYQ